jgi:hypothetical protein
LRVSKSCRQQHLPLNNCANEVCIGLFGNVKLQTMNNE